MMAIVELKTYTFACDGCENDLADGCEYSARKHAREAIADGAQRGGWVTAGKKVFCRGCVRAGRSHPGCVVSVERGDAVMAAHAVGGRRHIAQHQEGKVIEVSRVHKVKKSGFRVQLHAAGSSAAASASAKARRNSGVMSAFTRAVRRRWAFNRSSVSQLVKALERRTSWLRGASKWWKPVWAFGLPPVASPPAMPARMPPRPCWRRKRWMPQRCSI